MRIIIVEINMMQRPITIKVFLPALSTRTKLMKVMATLTAPMPRVACCAANSVKPADKKIDVE